MRLRSKKEVTEVRNNSKSTYTTGLVLIILWSTIIYFVFYFFKGMTGEAFPELEGPYDVVRVVDGDTIVVSMDGQDRNIRLIGIDAPESVADESYKENTEEGLQASQYMHELLDEKNVYLEYDREVYDSYGRKLCYVYLSDGRTMVNEVMLKNGYARIMTIEPNSKHESRLTAAQDKAKDEGLGFWGTGFYK